MSFIDNLLKEMQKNNVSALKLSKEIGFNHGAVTDWKNGKAKPSAETVAKIAEYFNITTDYLLGIEKPVPRGRALTEEEKRILDAFKTLNEDNQKFVVSTAEHLIAEQEK